jgi:hypothetical protein
MNHIYFEQLCFYLFSFQWNKTKCMCFNSCLMYTINILCLLNFAWSLFTVTWLKRNGNLIFLWMWFHMIEIKLLEECRLPEMSLWNIWLVHFFYSCPFLCLALINVYIYCEYLALGSWNFLCTQHLWFLCFSLFL